MISTFTKRSIEHSKLFFYLICFLALNQQVFGQTAPVISYPNNLSFVNNAPISPISPTNTGGAISNDTLTNVSTFLPASNKIQAFTIDKDNNIHTISCSYYGNPSNITTLKKYSPTGVLISTKVINGLVTPNSFVIDKDGNYFFADYQYIKMVSSNGYVQTVAGKPTAYIDPPDYNALNTSIGPTDMQLGDPGQIIYTSNYYIYAYYYTGYWAGKTMKIGPGDRNNYRLSGKRILTPNQTYLTYSIKHWLYEYRISLEWGGVNKSYPYKLGFDHIGGVMLDFRGYAILAANKQFISIAPDGKESNYAGYDGNYFTGGYNNSSIDGRGSNASFKPVTQTQMDGESSLFALEEYGGALRKIRPNGYYTIPKLPAGLKMDQRTGVISGTPTELVANKTYKVIAHNEFGTASYNLTLSVVNLPLVTSAEAVSVTQASASAGGNVVSAGGQPVTARGVCWNTATMPTIANSKTTDGSGLGSYSSSLTGLSANTIYYARAYATSALGTNYGAEKIFSTNLAPVITSNGGTATATINVAENSTAVTTVTSTDGDNPALSQTATYSIIGGADAAKFTINSSTGVLEFITAPDFELPSDADGNNVYVVEVKVMDNGSIPKFSTQTILVTITDVADLISIKPYAKPATTSADLGGELFVDYTNRNNAITEKGIVYALTSANNNPIIGGTGVTKIVSSEAATNFIEYTPGLLATTGYTFKAYVINANGTSYSAPISFTTNSSLAAPTITYSPQSEYGINTPVKLSVINSGGDVVAGIYKKVTTIAGSGSSGGANNANLLLSQFNRPSGITRDALGNYYICEQGDERIRKISSTGVITTVVDFSDNGYSQPLDLVIDGRNGNLYYTVGSGSVNRLLNSDSLNYPNSSPTYVTSSTNLDTYEFAGTRNSYAFLNAAGRSARFSAPKGMTISPDNTYLLIADERNSLIRKVTIPYADVTTFAGVQDGVDYTTAQNVTNGTVTTAKFVHPFDVAITNDGLTVYVAEAQSGNRIRKIVGGNVTTLAGKNDGTTGNIDDGNGTNATFYTPMGLAIDPAGNLYVAEREGVDIRKVTPSGDVSTIAGGSFKWGSVDGVGFNATFSYANVASMNFMYFDPSGFLMYPDWTNHKIRKINVAGFEISHPLPLGLSFNDKNGEITGTPTENTYKNQYANNFNSGSIGTAVSGGTISLTGSAVILGDHLRLAAGIAQTGAIVIPTGGKTQDEYRIHFNLKQFSQDNSSNKSYISYSFTDQTVATSTNGYVGDGISIVFDRLASPDNIYLRYGSGGNSYTTPGTAITSWKGKTSTVDIKINALGQISLWLDGVAVFTNTTANSSFTNADKSNFKHVITGGTASGNFDILEVDDIVIQEGIGASDYTITGYNGYGKSTITKTFNVVNAPLTVAYSSNNINVNNGSLVGNYTPTVTGGVPSTYTIAPSLTAGLTLNASTGIISGRPTIAAASKNYSITASNVAGSATTSVTITVAEVAPTALQFSQAGTIIQSLTATNGIAIGTITPTNTGGTVVSYSVTPNLPLGIFLNNETGFITGTPTVNAATATYTFTATNSIGSTSKALNITVNAAAPSSLSYAPIVGDNNSSIETVNPTVTGGTPTSYSISPTLPNGISLNTTNGTIAGTPRIASPITTYTITATNVTGSATATTTVVVNDVAPSNLTYNTTKFIGSNGKAITTMYANASGGAITNFTISPSLPTGLIFNGITGTISGTPIAASPLTSYLITASNNAGATTNTINIEILESVPTITYPNTTESLIVGWPIDITPTSISVGNTNFNIGTFQFSSNPALPAGLTINVNTGRITGAVQSTLPLTNYTITISNGTQSSTVAIALQVDDAPPSGLSYTTRTVMNSDGTSASTLTPISNGGRITSYAVSPSLPSGLTLNTTTGVVTGTPNATMSSTSYVITASSGIGSTTATVDLEVTSNAPTFSYVGGAFIAAAGVPINSIVPTISNSQTASFNIGTINYTIAPALPSGLTLNNLTGAITGTPTGTSASTNYIITATNGSNSTTSSLNIMIAGLPTIASTTVVTSIEKNAAISGGNVTSDGGLSIIEKGVCWSLNTNPTINDNGINNGLSTGVFTANMAGLEANTTYFVRAYATNAAGTSYGNEISFKTLPSIGYSTTNTFVRGTQKNIVPTISGANTLSFTSSTLPAGLTIDGTTGIISGTATTIQSAATFTITATNVDGGSTSTNLSISVITSNNSSLSGINLNIGTLTPNFNTSTYNYSSSVGSGTNSITITPVGSNSAATITVNGAALNNGVATVNLVTGTNTVTVVVTADDGVATNTYSLIVTKAATISNDASLGGFTLSTGTISPNFNTSTYNYTSSVGANTNSIVISPSGTNAQATITVNGAALTNGGATVNLISGTNTITVVVTAEDGIVTRSYTLIVTKTNSLSTNANLSNLVLSNATLSSNFVNSTVSYTSSVPYGTTSVTILPTLSDPLASIKVNNVTVANGASSNAINLAIGANTINVVVTAEDGTSTKTYSVIITRAAASAVATLSGFVINIGTLSPSFNAGIYNYTANVGSGTSSVTITPSGSNGQAVITVNGSVLTNGGATINLVTGTNTITVVVTAEDGVTTKSYVVIISRAAVTNPPNTNIDTDGDGVPDAVELTEGTDPSNPNDAKDTDKDIVPDYVETQEGTNPALAGDAKDTDGDGMADYLEIKNGYDPLVIDVPVDTDKDGVPDAVEIAEGTNPNNPIDAKDTDLDGVPDYIEVKQGTSPVNAIDVKDLFGAPAIKYANIPSVITSGVNIQLVPIASTLSIIKYTITPDLPSGLILDSTTGIISGAPIQAKKLTTYIVTATNAIGSRKSTFNMAVIPSLKPIVGSSIICGKSQSIQLSNEIPGGVWSSSNTLIAMVDINGKVIGVGNTADSVMITYTLTVDSSSNAVQHKVYYYPTAPISMRLNFQDIVIGKPTVLQSRPGGVKYEWSPSGVLDNSNIANPTAILNAATLFTIKVTAANGCLSVDTLPTRVFYEPEIHIPNVFSPNGDGMNDVLKLNFVNIAELKFFKVYDRYNRLVFESKSLVNTWDGSYLGRPLPSDTYYWIFSAVDNKGNAFSKSGPIIIIK